MNIHHLASPSISPAAPSPRAGAPAAAPPKRFRVRRHHRDPASPAGDRAAAPPGEAPRYPRDTAPPGGAGRRRRGAAGPVAYPRSRGVRRELPGPRAVLASLVASSPPACLPACLLAQPARWLSCGAVSQPPALGTSRGRGPEAVAWQGRGCRAGSRAEPCLDCHRLQGRRNRALPPLLLRKELDKGEPLLLGTPEAEGRSLWAAGIARLSQGMWERRSRAEPGTFGSFWGGQ